MDYSKPHLIIPVPGSAFADPRVRDLMSPEQHTLLGYIDGYNSLAALPTLVQRSLDDVIDLVDRLVVLDVLRIFQRSENKPAMLPPVQAYSPQVFENTDDTSDEIDAASDKSTIFEPIDDIVIVGQLLPLEEPHERLKLEADTQVPWTYSDLSQEAPQSRPASLQSDISSSDKPTHDELDDFPFDSWPELPARTPDTPPSQARRRSINFHNTAFFAEEGSVERAPQEQDVQTLKNHTLRSNLTPLAAWDRSVEVVKSEHTWGTSSEHTWGVSSHEHTWSAPPKREHQQSTAQQDTFSARTILSPQPNHTILSPPPRVHHEHAPVVKDTVLDWPDEGDMPPKRAEHPHPTLDRSPRDTGRQPAARSLHALLRRKLHAENQGENHSKDTVLHPTEPSWSHHTPPHANTISLAGSSKADSTINLRKKK